MKSYVINLDRDTERMGYMRKRFQELGISFERISATDGTLMSDDEFEAFAATRIRDNGPWRKAQAGCFLSHFAVWAKVAQSEERHAVIFEDDIHVADALKKVIADTYWIPDDADIIRLETSTNRLLLDKKPMRTIFGRQLHRLRSTSWCAGGYILSRVCAQRLISLPELEHNSTDYLLFSLEGSRIARSLTVYQVCPALVTQDKFAVSSPLGFGSNIEGQLHALSHRLIQNIKALPHVISKTIKDFKRIEFVP